MSRPEHRLQTAIGKFVRTAVIGPHRFACFDRSANSRDRHMWEANRHIRAGEPDTELLVPGLPAIRIELKAPGGKITDRQYSEGEAIQRAGHLFGVAHSVEAYGELLAEWRVCLAVNWRIQAQHHDALLAAVAAKEKLPKKAARAKAEKPTQTQLKRVAAVRGRVMF